MKLISCESCGVLLDTDRIEEPDIYEEDGDGFSSSDKTSLYRYGRTLSAIFCPVCKTLITYEGGES